MFATVPLLALFAHNLRYDLTARDALGPLAVILGATGLAMAVAWLAFRRNGLKAALAVSIAVILFFLYGPAAGAVAGWRVAGLHLGSQAVALSVWAALLVVGVIGVVKLDRHRLPGLTRGVNFVAAGLLILNIGMIGLYKFQSRGEPIVAGDVLRVHTGSTSATGTVTKPDIYYMMLEEYGGPKALKDLFGFDNQPFLDSLRARGFYVVDHPSTNYPHTAMSLASSLNLQYVQQLLPSAPSGDWSPLYELMKNDEVPRFLKSRGYTYIHMGSWWGPTASNPQADVNIKMAGALSEFSSTLIDTTVLHPIADAFSPQLKFDRREYVRVQFEFDQLRKTVKLGGPKFVFAHILVPHEPYIFDATGRYVTRTERAMLTREQAYIDQLQFANLEVERTLDALLALPEERRPVIVLQSDEGPFTGLDDEAVATDGELEQHFGILNAYYFPHVARTGLYPTVTPVNSFRLVFDDYFGAGLPLLPDQNYVFLDREHLYTFIDVTDRVRPRS